MNRNFRKLVYNNLVLAKNETVRYQILGCSTTKDLPEEDANLAWENLKSEFKPNTGARNAQLCMEFLQSVLKGGTKPPEEWMP